MSGAGVGFGGGGGVLCVSVRVKIVMNGTLSCSWHVPARRDVPPPLSCACVQIKGSDESGGGEAELDLDRPPTLEEQTQFAHNIYMIKSEELGEVVTKLDQSCPGALDKKADGRDELEINIDAIDHRTFHVLDRLVKSFLPDVVKKAKAKKPSAAAGAPPVKKQKA